MTRENRQALRQIPIDHLSCDITDPALEEVMTAHSSLRYVNNHRIAHVQAMLPTLRAALHAFAAHRQSAPPSEALLARLAVPSRRHAVSHCPSHAHGSKRKNFASGKAVTSSAWLPRTNVLRCSAIWPISPTSRISCTIISVYTSTRRSKPRAGSRGNRIPGTTGINKSAISSSTRALRVSVLTREVCVDGLSEKASLNRSIALLSGRGE